MAAEIDDCMEIAKRLWEANKANAGEVARASYAKFKVSDAALELIPNLAGLLAEVQHQAFLHGATAAVYSMWDGLDNIPDNQLTEAAQ